MKYLVVNDHTVSCTKMCLLEVCIIIGNDFIKKRNFLGRYMYMYLFIWQNSYILCWILLCSLCCNITSGFWGHFVEVKHIVIRVKVFFRRLGWRLMPWHHGIHGILRWRVHGGQWGIDIHLWIASFYIYM